MASYYAIERNEKYLAHYGIKGMHWGVRKAKESGNERALDRHWRRATRKQKRLNKKADWAHQKKNLELGTRLATTGTMTGGLVGGSLSGQLFPKNIGRAVALSTAGGLVGAVPGYIINRRAHKRMLPEGHQKALSDSRAWTKEMNRAFSGTKYQGKAKKFQDTYLMSRRVYDPKEAKRGNAMPYTLHVGVAKGNDLAYAYDKVYGKKRKRK